MKRTEEIMARNEVGSYASPKSYGATLVDAMGFHYLIIYMGQRKE